MANGVRTKNYNCFKEDVCTSVQSIKILHFNDSPHFTINIFVDGHIKFVRREHVNTGNKFMEKLAKNDGFDSVEDFFKWFKGDFHGVLIHWTDFKY